MQLTCDLLKIHQQFKKTIKLHVHDDLAVCAYTNRVLSVELNQKSLKKDQFTDADKSVTFTLYIHSWCIV